jgi:glutamate synthase (ferredoxin)
MTQEAVSPYQPQFERGGCGVGFVADQFGRSSHALLQLGLDALINLQHRGALDADAKTGDGAGVLTPLPCQLFAREAERLTNHSVDPDRLAVGVFFLEPHSSEACIPLVEAAVSAHGLEVVAWREVPIDTDTIGERAMLMMPRILQAIISQQPSGSSPQPFELQLYLARKQFECDARAAQLDAYVPSMSSRTIVYKGLLLAPQLPAFYLDLSDPDYEVPLVVFHQRYSTNTFPTWQRAQPFRVLCHNGEINTLQGNINWMRTREPKLDLAGLGDLSGLLRPVIDTTGSDSAMLDNAAELLVMGGRDLPHAITMLVPPAWEKLPDLPQDVRDFYAYHACLSEPWDGPAALMFTDGQIVGASLDRNGLRPCRYLVTDDGVIAAASEAGAVPVDDRHIILRGKLGPGHIIAVDTARGLFLEDNQIKSELAARNPYGLWVQQNLRKLKNVQCSMINDQTARLSLNFDHSALIIAQAAFGYTHEELTIVLKPMVENQAEAIGSMGDDTPSAVLSNKPRPLFGYFRQRFAEVTNPPIDPLREDLVMSLHVRLGARGNFLDETPQQARLLELETPFLTDDDLVALKNNPELHTVTVSTLIPMVGADLASAPGDHAGSPRPAIDLAAALDKLCERAETAIRSGAQVIVLSDRGVDPHHALIPSLLAVGAVHHHLLRVDLRTSVDLVVESGEPREVHHFATLIGYGAAAINPYLALATASTLGRDVKPDEAIRRYLHAAEHGLLKIMSKMGISTVDAYCGAQIFEIIGLSQPVIDQYFTGTPSHLGGIGLSEIASIGLAWHRSAFEGEVHLDSPGFYKFKREGEVHAFNPAIVHALHAAVKSPGALNGNWREGYPAYKQYSDLQHSRAPIDVRDFLEFKTIDHPVSIHSVESIHTIVWRFSTAAMSHGALSAEAHETMSIAMNRLNALSNSGEGGEDPARYHTEGNDRIKQVASGRFGVTPAYLISADELQIKMAQGSKPGEGGQLPGHKVTAEIAAIRHSTAGVTLISPPPHHDIYSIEDLAQLIYDLRQINPRTVISVKLVAQAGVGTIAAGVAKAGADVILISGNAGGTGASPLSSIKYAGVPWEIGLAEAQYVLVKSGLRGRVRLRTDGGLRTGRDVVMAALLGADEFSFGTAAVVAEGCLMARACHMNTCPAGIATQRPDLRAKFDATPEQVMAFMIYVAQEVREVLASLGLRSIDEAVGRVDLLRQKEAPLSRDVALDLSRLLIAPPDGQPRRYMAEPNRVSAASPLNGQLVSDAWFTLNLNRPAALSYRITNRDRTFGAKLSSLIAEQYGDAGLTDGAFDVTLQGSAGQSFGAFGVNGLNLTLVGEANDYVGKGLAGGRIVIIPPPMTNDQLPMTNPVLAGNTILYGATGGELYIAGRVGERFAVRNSGAITIVEGVGDHGCEYMTGGLAIILGPIGYNFAAGMTGGLAFVFDEDDRAAAHINSQLVSVERPTPFEIEYLHQWITHHAQLTSSEKAQALLRDWHVNSGRFLKITPKDQAAQAQPIAIRPASAAESILIERRTFYERR